MYNFETDYAQQNISQVEYYHLQCSLCYCCVRNCDELYLDVGGGSIAASHLKDHAVDRHNN
jgi:hypothetical protein